MREGLNVILRYDEAWNGVNIWIVKKEGQTLQVVQPLNMMITSYVNPGNVALTPEPTIKIDMQAGRQFLQDLADGLTNAGFRPDELKAKDSEVEAIKAHLADMRQLVFEALMPPQLPPAYVPTGRFTQERTSTDEVHNK
jgi:hypothetical protein